MCLRLKNDLQDFFLIILWNIWLYILEFLSIFGILIVIENLDKNSNRDCSFGQSPRSRLQLWARNAMKITIGDKKPIAIAIADKTSNRDCNCSNSNLFLSIAITIDWEKFLAFICVFVHLHFAVVHNFSWWTTAEGRWTKTQTETYLWCDSQGWTPFCTTTTATQRLAICELRTFVKFFIPSLTSYSVDTMDENDDDCSFEERKSNPNTKMKYKYLD